MRQLLFICVILPNFCFAGVDARMLYIKAVEDFSTCGNALMPWGGNGWRPDEVEKPYVLQAKINRTKMQTEIDEAFYAEANLEELYVALTNDFYKKTADITATLKKLPAEDHSVIGGLGGAVSEYIVSKNPVPLEKVGVQDRFGESGDSDELMQLMGLKSTDIVAAAKRVIQRK